MLTAKQSCFRQLPRAREGKLAGLLALGTVLCLAASALKWVDPSYALPKPIKVKTKQITTIDYQIFALQQIRSIRQFNCLITLWNRESNWRSKARNGSHYGIPQGESYYLHGLSADRQILWGIAYIGHRYGHDLNGKVNACAALAHSYAHYWY